MIIMLTGKAGCGKDTAYKIMKKYANKSIKRYAFADALKNIAMGLAGMALKMTRAGNCLFPLARLLISIRKTSLSLRQQMP